jgi:hypothetical protein
LALARLAPGRFFALAALRPGFLFAVFDREDFVARLEAGLRTRAVAFFTAGLSRPLLAAFPAIAPTIPPTTAAAGPIMLPSAAPATAPAVSFGIGGTSMFSSAFEFSGIKRSSSIFAALLFVSTSLPGFDPAVTKKKAVAGSNRSQKNKIR